MSEITTYSDGPLGWLTISAPEKLNSMSEKMWQQFPDAVAKLEKDPDIRVLIVRGDGTKAFSTGADISEFDRLRDGDNAQSYNQLNHDAFDALQQCSKPTIAMIHGFCMGGGFLIAHSVDLRLAGASARFSLPPAKLGIGFDVRWVALVLKTLPAALAKEMFFTGGRYEARQLQAFSTLNQVVEDDELLETTQTLAQTIAANAPLTIQSVKGAIEALSRNDHHIDFDAHDALTQACFESEDYKEGRQAFKERRAPVFKGN